MRIRSALLGALLLLPACQGLGEMKDLLIDLQTLQQGLMRELNEPGVNVNQSNSQLSVILVNSTRAALPEAEREREARRIAEFVRDRYPRYPALASISVGFTSAKGGMGVTVSTTQVPYLYRTAELGIAPGADTVTSPAAPVEAAPATP